MFIDFYGTLVSVLILLVLWLFYRLNRLEKFMLELHQRFLVYEKREEAFDVTVEEKEEA